ncbi:acylneuraminate cytidylyltransferase family protein [bacterium]|nr:acylneuraminate cytidylyltransferase family protein [bacterium]
MYNNKKIIAIIPARSGSKGLKDKNIKDLMGKPLIAHTIEAALNSKVFDCVFCSTDSEVYAKIAKKYGASVPFLRSKENSLDKSGSWDVVKEVLSKLDEKYDIVALLQPTSPLRTSDDIKNALDVFFKKDADTVVSVTPTAHSAFWCNTLDENNSMKDFIKPEYNKARQELPETYSINGAIYIVKNSFLDDLNLYGDNSFAYIMKREHSIDIDCAFDFKLAELYLQE